VAQWPLLTPRELEHLLSAQRKRDLTTGLLLAGANDLQNLGADPFGSDAPRAGATSSTAINGEWGSQRDSSSSSPTDQSGSATLVAGLATVQRSGSALLGGLRVRRAVALGSGVPRASQMVREGPRRGRDDTA
jgi:hypothetical protein